VTGIVSLADARETSIFGSKAVGLGEALRAGLLVPPGVALAGPVVEAVATGDEAVIEEVNELVRPLPGPLAVRSSAVDEDSAEASFAGQHLTLLNVPSVDELVPALRDIWWSANSDSAISYRQRVGLFTRPSIGVVVQSLLDPDVAGVMFTQNPVTGADERLIEASWGLGEAVVAALVIPDDYRIDRAGQVLERTPGRKKVAIRSLPDGGTTTEAVADALVEALCLDDEELGQLGVLAARCEEVYGPGRDIEWALAEGRLYLLQCRAVTTTAGSGRKSVTPSSAGTADRADALTRVALFSCLDRGEREQVEGLFKERRFSKGETVMREGTGGAAFFLIDSGKATVSVGGVPRATLEAGDYFGEIALIDEGPRSATVTAASDLVCHGITLWDFRPLIESNGAIAWKLLQSMVRKLREAEKTHQALAEPDQAAG
jgi:pyruvate,water dikinase